MKNKHKLIVFMLFLVLNSILFSGCTEDEPSVDSDMFLFDNLEVKTRCSYDDTIYRDSVLEISVRLTNEDVNAGSYNVKLFIDDYLEDNETVMLEGSESKTIMLTNLDSYDSNLIISGLRLNETGIHRIIVGNISENISVSPPVLIVDVKDVKWTEQDEGYKPWITLQVQNPTDKHFYLGGSFAIGTKEGIYQADVEEWALIVGYVNNTGYYKIPGYGVADVVIMGYDVVSDYPDGHDVHLDFIRIYAGFPWLDFTGGIIGEAEL